MARSATSAGRIAWAACSTVAEPRIPPESGAVGPFADDCPGESEGTTFFVQDGSPVLMTPVTLRAVDATLLEQLLDARRAASSAFVGAAPSTTTSLTRCIDFPAAVSAVIRYVPGFKGRPATRPANRTLLTPARPRTENRPTV